MKYQSVIIESQDIEIKDAKSLLVNEFNIPEVTDFNLLLTDKPETKESIGISEVEDLTEWAYKKSDQLRLIIINRAELLTDQAQNSLLKLIEEPPENVLMALITNNPNSILVTILSRCLLIKDKRNFSKDIVNAKNFINLNYLERARIIDRMFSEDLSRINAASFVEEVLKAKLQQNNAENFEEIKKIYKSIKKGTNLKLCFEYLNILLN